MPVPAELLKQVKGLALRTRGVVDSLFSGEFRSVFRGQGMEFAEVRAYEEGDDFRAIDWNVSARLGTPYVKTFTEERELTLLLVVDQSGSTRVGVPVTKAARSVEVAAVLALAGAREQDRVGAILFSDKVEHVVPPAKGRRHALRLIRDLLAFASARRGTNLVQAIHYASRVLGHRSVVIILSDFLAEGWEKALRELAVRHEVIAITIDDPRESDPPAAGWVEMEDAENGRRSLVNTGSAKAMGRWRAGVTARRLQRAERLRAAGVEQIALDVASEYGMILRRAFARRIRRQAGAAPVTGLQLLVLLQAGAVTVGDTVRVERLLGPVGGVVVRPQPWNLGGLGQQLGPAEVTLGPEGTLVRYNLVLWYPGDHTLTMPGAIVVRRDGQSDTLAASTARVRVSSVLPQGERKATIPPKPRSNPIPLEARTLLPALVLLLVTLLLVLPIGWRWRRRGKLPPRPTAVMPRPGPDVITRWATAGEYRAALDGWGWILARRLAASTDLRETAELQRVLDDISFGAFSPVPEERLKALCDRAARLGAP